MKKNQRPNKGDTLTLRYKYWHGGAVPGTKVKVLAVRADKECLSGLGILVSIPNVMHPTRLDATWFKEFTPDFVYTPKKSRKTVAHAPEPALENLLLANAKEFDDLMRQVLAALWKLGVRKGELRERLTALIHWNREAIKATTGKKI